ncbi:hypothetical protein MXB_4985 [Myxobolus squamalis]|nr:hypothetical protein MXB_4985 [Myxobolus squamalis]
MTDKLLNAYDLEFNRINNAIKSDITTRDRINARGPGLLIAQSRMPNIFDIYMDSEKNLDNFSLSFIGCKCADVSMSINANICRVIYYLKLTPDNDVFIHVFYNNKDIYGSPFHILVI